MNKQKYISFITDELEKGNDWKNTFALFKRKFALTRQTFDKYWKIANEAYSKRLSEINELKAEQYKESELKAHRDGVQTKQERILMLQKELIKCYEDLESGMTDDSFITKAEKPTSYKRKMSTSEINQTRKVAKDLSAEISKLNNDYLEHNKGKETVINIINLDNLGKEENDPIE